MPSQRLSTGELVIPGAGRSAVWREAFHHFRRRIRELAGEPAVSGTTLATPLLTVKLDEQTGDIVSLRATGIDAELADGRINQLSLPARRAT